MKYHFSAAAAFVAGVLAVPSTALAATGQAPSGPPVWQIFAVVGGAYLVAHLATRKNPKRMFAVRKAWNIVLLVSFLVVGVTGAASALFAQFGWMWLLNLSDYNLHVTFGLVMAAVALFHAAWHWRYFLSMLKRPSATSASDHPAA